MIGKYETLVDPNFDKKLTIETENIIMTTDDKILEYKNGRSSKPVNASDFELQHMDTNIFFNSLKHLFCLIFREELAKYIQHYLLFSSAEEKKNFESYFNTSANRGHCLNAFIDKSFFLNFGTFIQEVKQNIDGFYDNEDDNFGSIQGKQIEVTQKTSNTLETHYNYDPREKKIESLLHVYANYYQKKVKIIIREAEDVEKMPNEYPANKNDKVFAMDIFFSVHQNKTIKFKFFSQIIENKDSENYKSYYVTNFMYVFSQGTRFYFYLKDTTTQKITKCFFGQERPLKLRNECVFYTTEEFSGEAKEVIFEKEEQGNKVLLKIILVEEDLVCSLLFSETEQVDSLFEQLDSL